VLLTFDDDIDGNKNFHLSTKVALCVLAVDIIVFAVEGVDNFIRLVKLSNCVISFVLSFGSQIKDVVAIYICVYI
jgi:hypothetical protein